MIRTLRNLEIKEVVDLLSLDYQMYRLYIQIKVQKIYEYFEREEKKKECTKKIYKCTVTGKRNKGKYIADTSTYKRSKGERKVENESKGTKFHTSQSPGYVTLATNIQSSKWQKLLLKNGSLKCKLILGTRRNGGDTILNERYYTMGGSTMSASSTVIRVGR
jgi:hypothetical protein